MERKSEARCREKVVIDSGEMWISLEGAEVAETGPGVAVRKPWRASLGDEENSPRRVI